MSKAGYQVISTTQVTLVANTPKSILGVRAGASFGLDLQDWNVYFNGTSAAQVPVVIDLCYATFATNPPGTASTSETPVQQYGRVLTHGMTAARNWTTEPTALTVIGKGFLSPAGGFIIRDIPLGRTPDTALNEGFVIRCTTPSGAANVDVIGELLVERV